MGLCYVIAADIAVGVFTIFKFTPLIIERVIDSKATGGEFPDAKQEFERLLSLGDTDNMHHRGKYAKKCAIAI